jgi:5'-nucleotidase / UDP-sugar diphosphatase
MRMLPALRRPAVVVILILGLFCARPAWFGAGVAPSLHAQTPVSVVFAHINDIYEIDAIEGGAVGGMARVATVFDRLRLTGSPVLTTLGGDFLSPSAIGSARVNGEALAGRQMVDVLNTVGLGWATLGNHEFDLSEAAFRARMTEAKFTTVVSNVTDSQGELFSGTVRSAIAPVRVNQRVVRVGFLGLVTNFNKKPWVRYQPAIDAARAQVAAFRDKVDVIVALTHLPLEEDQAVVEAVPEIDLVLGGHEHENWYLRRGPSFAPIVKADANARSIAVVTMRIGATGTRPEVSVRFDSLDARVALQPRTEAVVRRWMDAGIAAFKRDGLVPEAVVAVVPIALDGREGTVRRRSGELTSLIAEAMRRETQADIGILNGGTVRIDDVLRPGPVRQYDVIRVLPFGGKVLRATVDGALLARLLDMGVQNIGIGGFLHPTGVTREGSTWVVNGRPLDPAAAYTIGVPEFLLTGGETRMDFLVRTNPQVRDVQEFRDIRVVVMDELRRRFGQGSGFFDDRLERVAGFARQ